MKFTRKEQIGTESPTKGVLIAGSIFSLYVVLVWLFVYYWRLL